MSWIQTYTGRKFFPLDPRPEDVDIRDIAHALAYKCRFGGHCLVFYSVAQHAVAVSRIVPPHLALWGLMHDAGEAYLADVGRPVKHAMHVAVDNRLETFDAVEDRVLGVIARALGFPPIQYAAIADADTILLATEARDLMAAPPEPWALGVEPLPDTIMPLNAHDAEELFLRTYHALHPAHPMT